MSTGFITYSFRRYSKSLNSKLNKLLITMPKEQKHIAEAQKQRKKIKEKFSKYVPGKVTLQVLGSGAKGAPRSLYVFSDQSRYLFNCGEGTQRLAHEHKMKLAKLEHIFITEPAWENFGGLPGAALTIQDVGVPEIVLHGPQGLEELFVATRRFVIIKDLQINVAACGEFDGFEDNVMKVKYVPIIKKQISKEDNVDEINENIIEDDTDYYAHESSGRQVKSGVPIENSKSLMQKTREKGISMAYICQLQPRPGALCLDKCVRFGVPPGPLLGKLKSGEDVTLPNGNVVRTSDVCDPDDPGPIFIVVDCPDEDYLDSLVGNEIFKRYQVSAEKDEDVAALIVHFTPKNVMDTPRYKKWIDNFSPSTQHLLINESNTCMGSLSVHRIQYKLNLLSPEIFPLLGDSGTEIITEDPQDSLQENKKLKLENSAIPLENLSVTSPKPVVDNQFLISPKTLCNHHLRPRKGTDKSVELKIFPTQFIDETLELENFSQILKDVKIELEEKRNRLTITDYPKLLFLGTGSSIPNKTRNTSGILIEINENCVIIMDCGEGTYGQIVRFFGQDKCDEILTKIKGVYISHLHADHHLGLIGLLQGRRKAFVNLNIDPTPALLIAPKQIQWWLSFYDHYFENINKDFELISNSDLLLDGHTLETCREEKLLETLHLNAINTCFVKHCPNAFGVAITNRSGLKITYSGDTMPSKSLVELGQNSDVLIHEATMEDELANEAVIKLHSTTSQAIEIGREMNAKYTLLTHFSQRYAKLPRFNDNFSENVGIAFDNMQIKLDELPLLPILYPALKLMFAEHYEELEIKAAKRLMKIEREKEAIREKQKM